MNEKWLTYYIFLLLVGIFIWIFGSILTEWYYSSDYYLEKTIIVSSTIEEEGIKKVEPETLKKISHYAETL